MPYYNIHCHSFYSTGDSILDPEKCALWLKQRNLDRIAVTDHGNVAGVFNTRAAMKKHGIKHFPGSEFYFCDDRNSKTKENRKAEHLIGIAKTYEGSLNLFKLSSFSFTEGFYYKPRIDYELVQKYNKGIIFSSACLKGPVSKKLLENDFEGAVKVASKFKEILGENFFLEIMPHDIEEQRICNKGIIEISKKLDIKIVASNDVHYIESGDHEFRDILIMANQKTTINQKDRMQTDCNTLYMMEEGEVKEKFKIFHSYIDEKTLKEAIENTGVILDGEPPEMSDGKLNFPTYSIDNKNGENFTKEEVKLVDEGKQDEFLRVLVQKGLKEKGLYDKKEYQERFESEYEIIKKMGFVNYFLIVRDIVKHCQEVGIKVGPGRGTACSSLISYCIGITKLDPIKYDLIFERFINPHRVGLPDIDLDFDNQKRGEVIKYIYDKYGIDNVTQIATVSKLAIKSAIRDVARVLEMNTDEALKISMGAPWQDYKTVEETCENHPEARELVLNNKELFKFVNKLVGVPRQFGKHPSGVVISSKKISEFAPLMYGKEDGNKDKVIMVQFDMDCIKKVGLVKMDILGLKTLGFIEDILKQIKKTKGKSINVDNIDYEDEEVYKMIASGDTAYCFQIEADGITKAIKRIQPDCFHELYDLLSLYRPGGLETGQLEKYIETKFIMKESPEYRMYPDIPEMEKILRPTYYTVCYQEQIMAIVGRVAGLGMATADVFRRIIDDLKLENKEQTVAEYKEKFLSGCVKNGITELRAMELWEFLAKYTGYSFNKSHSCIPMSESILTDHGPMTFKQVFESDIKLKALSYNELYGIQEFKTIKKKFSNGNKEVFEFDLNNGKSIKCTEDHMFLTKEGYKPIKEIYEKQIEFFEG